MFVETDLPREAATVHKAAEPLDHESQEAKSGFLEKGGGDKSSTRGGAAGGGGGGAGASASSAHHQELTLSYMCENQLLAFGDKDAPAASGSGTDLLGSLDKARSKGKEVAMDFSTDEDQRWVERDFLQLGGGSSSCKVLAKREMLEDGDPDANEEGRFKKPKMETLNLSLGPPSLSLSLNSLNPAPNGNVGAAAMAGSVPNSSSAAGTSAGPASAAVISSGTAAATTAQAFAEPQAAAPVRRTQSNNTLNTRASSDDFTVSLSHSCSLAFSHNPSCSLTRNSTENYEYSRGTDHIWYAGGGEGTNGSVHSRFRPVGDGTNNSISFSNHGGFSRVLNGVNNRDVGSSHLFKGTGSESNSFFPSELPARSVKDMCKAGPESVPNAANIRPEQLLKEILSESLTSVKKLLLELPNDVIQATKDYLKTVMNDPEKRGEFASLQKRLSRRADLTFQSLVHAHKAQIDILVTVKTGLENYLYGKIPRPTTELVEIFLLKRCRNAKCNNMLPVEDCGCDICSTNEGFCSACMCPVCMKFDCAENTCSWVGCDVCSHWCHALCGIEKNLIRPGPTLKGTAGTTEMQFHCLGCGHASEMFGFVKDVFLCCAKDWGLETLKKELDCVRKIFRGSEDAKGRELYRKTDEVFTMLEKKLISPNGACDSLLQFLKYGPLDFSSPVSASKEVLVATPLASMPPKPTYALTSPLSAAAAQLSVPEKVDLKASSLELPSSPAISSLQKTPSVAAATSSKATSVAAEGFESLESMVQFKQAEAALFQRLADEARREVERYRQIARAKMEKLEEEYASKLAQLCLQETEERRLKKLEELKLLESSHCDYYKMKIRMETEMASLLERMEATKKQLA